MQIFRCQYALTYLGLQHSWYCGSPLYNIHMAHVCECDIQICCPEVEMSTWGRRPSVDILTKGQHIWMSCEQSCTICFVVWPTTITRDRNNSIKCHIVVPKDPCPNVNQPGMPMFGHPQNCPFLGGSGPPCNTWLRGTIRVNGISIGSAVFAVIISITYIHAQPRTMPRRL